MNTSMTINATAMWLLALYQVLAEEQGADLTALTGTTQNDIIKEYLSRGTYVFPPAPSLRLVTDVVAHTVSVMPQWNPTNICSYHLQEAGATPVQEVAFAMSTAIAVLDAVRDAGQVPPERFGEVVQRISFFVNAGVRFVEEMCKMRAFVALWDEVTRDRYGITDARQRRFRYGVQVNSLGLTAVQPENNMARIMLEMLAVTLSKDARARAVQLPAWNEALGLPRPWDQQWSLRMQQVLAMESDLLEYPDLFEGSPVVAAKVEQILVGARTEMATLEQTRDSLDPTWTLAQALTGGRGDHVEVGGRAKHVVAYMKDFLFEGEQAKTPLRVLSGGERGRLMLARALAKPSNVLVLDEPTNDLDMQTLDVLEEMLGDYAGTVLLISHDRDFLDRVVHAVIVPSGDGRWAEYPGGYTEMLAQRGEAPVSRTAPKAKAESRPQPAEPPKPAKSAKRRLSFHEKHALETLPGEIAKLQGKVRALQKTFDDPDLYARDPQAFTETSTRLAAAHAGLSAAEERWLALEILREEVEGG